MQMERMEEVMLTNDAAQRSLAAADNTCCCNEIESGAAEAERRAGGRRASHFPRQARLRLGKVEKKTWHFSIPLLKTKGI